ncbi:ATPase component of various ABC-type transport systems with duplicated ATPase domain protein [Cryptobacterium curtum DSM 15641]|uniref:ATPase component of various ABC-type transport systems with duplicated ATPase domain protein n=2 Tax=Cryptobacterium TaxID=84162 RepID=C7MMN5_CRYCD|nr:ATPase component of various ABC-type transport systems with duplicated ATPase domain protein [Cryptobacterium curtum DSM 15641]
MAHDVMAGSTTHTTEGALRESSPVLSVYDLHVAYPDCEKEAVGGVSFDLAAGELLGIVGESGAGKSTLLRALQCLLPSAKVNGRILLCERDLLTLSEEDMRSLRGRQLAIIYQNPASRFDPTMRIGIQLAESIRLKEGCSRQIARKAARDLLQEFGFSNVGHVFDAYPFELSGGQLQRAAIALALAFAPQVLLADEPTSALDTLSRRTTIDFLMQQAKAHGTALVLVSHDISLVAHTCDRMAVMQQGTFVEYGNTTHLLRYPSTALTRALIAATPRLDGNQKSRFFANTVSAVNGLSVADKLSATDDLSVASNLPTISDLSITNDLSLDADELPPTGKFSVADELLVTDELLRFEKVSQRWRHGSDFVMAVSSFNLTLHEGESVALVGESGAGKSSVARIGALLDRPYAGQVFWHGRSVSNLSASALRALRPQIQFVAQDPVLAFDRHLTVERLLAEPVRNFKVCPANKRIQHIHTLLEEVSLSPDVLNKRPFELSGGQLQRVAIARALASSPALLILDEATSSLDTIVQDQILCLLEDIQARQGITYLFVHHDLAVAQRLCNRIIVMRDGNVEARLAARDLGEGVEGFTGELVRARFSLGVEE